MKGASAYSRPASQGFTIVELLIVIVVIAILAAITIVAYSGIQNRANDSIVQSDLDTFTKKLMLGKIENGKIFTPSQISQSQPTAQDKLELARALPIAQGSYTSTGVAFLYSVRNEESSERAVPVFAAVSKSGHVYLYDGTKLRPYNGAWNQEDIVSELSAGPGTFGWSCFVRYYTWSHSDGWQSEPEYC